ncbi:MAG: AraC family transcriptional regulator [Pseudonocardiaceae bacterium]|nr:MAG: AraC family transcriptional regulator [Pseudonocardiaceae bacterium]
MQAEPGQAGGSISPPAKNMKYSVPTNASMIAVPTTLPLVRPWVPAQMARPASAKAPRTSSCSTMCVVDMPAARANFTSRTISMIWMGTVSSAKLPNGLGSSFVIVNATDPDLDPPLVARTHHISLRLLQAMFTDVGSSPARFIRDQRLMNTRRLLNGGESIARAGALSGFPDPGTFTRAFRRRFGCTPTAFLNGYQPMP